MKNSKQKAFTLAEVLITLGIIGVVAAMTIPNLITNYKAHQLRSQFLKAYSLTQQAFKLMEEDDISLDPTSYPGVTFYKTFQKYFTGSIDCQAPSARQKKPCYHLNSSAPDAYKTYHGSYFHGFKLDDGQFALQDGTLFLFENPNAKDTPILISVDINGFGNKPNKAGYDLFTFQFFDGELKTMGAIGTQYDVEKYCNKNTNNAFNGIACAQKAKEDPDYFKNLLKE